MMVQKEMSKKTEEDRDTESRKRNIVIYRVPEKTTQNVSERKANGESYVRDLLDAVFNIKLEKEDVEKLYRLRQWSEGKARPLLIGFKNSELKQTIMANLGNLKQQHIARFRGISISHDLHPKERKEIKSMLQKAKDEHLDDDSESAENFWFKVVGKSQRKKVLKIRKQVSAS